VRIRPKIAIQTKSIYRNSIISIITCHRKPFGISEMKFVNSSEIFSIFLKENSVVLYEILGA